MSNIKNTFKTSVLVVMGLLLAFGFGFLVKGTIAGSSDPNAAHDHDDTAQVKWWTCSMHPTVKMDYKGLCPICNMDLIPLVSSDQVGERQLKVSKNAAKLMGIQTASVERRLVSTEIRMVGKVAYDETRLSYITAWVPGRLDKLYVDYTGLAVRQGDPMVWLYSPELISAQQELLQAIEAAKTDEQSPILRDMTQSTVKASQEKLRLWGLTPEQIQEIETSRQPSDHMNINAPASGIVIHKNALEGMYVKEGTRIYTIADLSQIWVQLDAYESDLHGLHLDQAVTFTTISYPGESFSGTISFIDPILNDRTRTVKVRVSVTNEQRKLKPGMFVKAIVQAEVANESQDMPLVIPATAPLITGSRAVVYVQLPDTNTPLFEGREVVLGPRAGDYYLVNEGLKEGELVVTQGNFKIDSSLQIQAKPSMMSLAPMDMNHDAMSHAPVNTTFLAQLDGLFAAYFAMQAALASDDPVKASLAAKQGLNALSNVNMSLVTEQHQTEWMTAGKSIKSAWTQASKTQDVKLLREQFYLLSQAMMSLTQHFGVTSDAPVYQFHCPMAFDNQGASWLQDANDLLNPYFGATMLKCGMLEEVYEAE